MKYDKSLLEFETCLGLGPVKLNEDPVSDRNALLFLFKKWMTASFSLQKLWNYEKNANYFKDFTLPHCTCLTVDNMERLGTKYRIVSADCIYHG